MNLEAELTRREPAGAKLHTGRSRNDQVALDTRMWLREELCELADEIHDLQLALVELGEKNSKVLIPGYTHLQRAQPVYLAHHLLAYVEMLERDYERLLDCLVRVNVCPLGSGALAGTTLPLDREFVARELGFVDAHEEPMICENSMDAVSDRDFVVEFCAEARHALILNMGRTNMFTPRPVAIGVHPNVPTIAAALCLVPSPALGIRGTLEIAGHNGHSFWGEQISLHGNGVTLGA